MHLKGTICAVVPVYNAQSTLPRLVEELTAVLRRFRDYHIVLVDDCSKDGSFSLIRELCRLDRHLTGIRLAENRGQQSAVFCGLHEVRQDYAVVIDDDLEQSPADIPRLYAELQKGYDAVYGVPPPGGGKGPFRRLGSLLRDRLFDAVTGKPREVRVSSFRILNRSSVAWILEADTRFVYVSMELLKHTARIGNVPIAALPSGPSNYRAAALIRLMLRMVVYYAPGPFWTRFRRSGPCFRVAERMEGGVRQCG